MKDLIQEIADNNNIKVSFDSEGKLTEESRKEFEDKVDRVCISVHQKLSEDFIREFQDKIYWGYISIHQKLSEDFIREFKDKVNWYYISINQKLSEDFIREFKDKVYWGCISMYQKLSEDFIREFEWKLPSDVKDSQKKLRIREMKELIQEIADRYDIEVFFDSEGKLTEDSRKEFEDKVDWVYVSANQKLSEDFIRKFQYKVSWDWISGYQKLSGEFIREFQDKVSWDWISINQNLSEDFIREFQDKVSWDWISGKQKLSEDFIREFQDKVSWDWISTYQKLSEEFIKEFENKLLFNIKDIQKKFKNQEMKKLIQEIADNNNIKVSFDSEGKLTEESRKEFEDKVDWYHISEHQKLSEDFIREFQDKVDWYWISINQKLSEGFIREFQDRVIWDCISVNQKLSEDFIREFKDKVDWDCISVNQKLSEEFIREFQDKVDWYCISMYQNLSEEFIREFINMKKDTKTHWVGVIDACSVNIIKIEYNLKDYEDSDTEFCLETLVEDTLDNLADQDILDGWEHYDLNIALDQNEWLNFATEAVEYLGTNAVGLPRKFDLAELSKHDSVHLMDQDGVDLKDVASITPPNEDTDSVDKKIAKGSSLNDSKDPIVENNWVFGTDSLGNAWAINMNNITEKDLSQRLNKMTKAGYLPPDEAGYWTSIYFEDAYNEFRNNAIDGNIGGDNWELSEVFKIENWFAQCTKNGLTPNIISEFGYNYLTEEHLKSKVIKTTAPTKWITDYWKIGTDNGIIIIPSEQTLEKEQEKKKMDMSMVKETLKTSAKDIGSAAKLGAELETVERTNDFVYNQIVELASKHLGVDRDKMNEPLVKETVLAILPLLLHPTAVAMEGTVPYANKAKQYAERSITVNTKRNVGAGMEMLKGLFQMFSVMNSEEERKVTFSVDYSKFSRAQLREKAIEKKLRISTKTKKEELIELLQEQELIDQGLLEVDEERVIA